MKRHSPSRVRSPLRAAAILIALAALSSLSGSARAQGPTRRLLGSFLSNGAYFFSARSGRNALGSAQFYNETAIFGRPKRFANLIEISGGLQIISVNDHLFPFSGGNQFNLVGPGLRVTTKRVLGQARPYLSTGLFVGNLRSDRLNINVTDFTPSLSVGVEWPFARYFTLTAGYRVTENISGVNLDGFILTLRIF